MTDYTALKELTTDLWTRTAGSHSSSCRWEIAGEPCTCLAAVHVSSAEIDMLLKAIAELEAEVERLTEIAEALRDTDQLQNVVNALNAPLISGRKRAEAAEARVKELEEDIEANWELVIKTCRQAWPVKKKVFYCQCPTELIIDIINERDEAKNDLTTNQSEVAVLRGALEETAEALDLWATERGMPTEGASPRADAETHGVIGILTRARQALSPETTEDTP